MKLSSLFFGLASLAVFSPLGAGPVAFENFDYKISLSETLPGIDNAPATAGGPVINVDVTDKRRSLTTRFPLGIYAIQQYFLEGDKLNLLCRTSLRDNPRQLYSFIQLNLSNSSDSRQYSGLEKYYFSPDQGELLAVIDEGDGGESLGLIRLNRGPAGLDWLYSEREKANLFRQSLGQGKGLRLASTAGWSADAQAAAFVLSDKEAKGGTKFYLACLFLTEEQVGAAAKEVDLSAFQIPEGGTIDKVDCVGDVATLYFPPKDLSGASKVVLKLPRPLAPPTPGP